MRKKITGLLLIYTLIFISKPAFAQETSTEDIHIQEKIENIAEDLENENLDYTYLVERLTYLQKNKLNLNQSNRENLLELQLLNEIQINNLLEHIAKNGPLLSVYELQTINGFDLETIQKIIPYVWVSGQLDDRSMALNSILQNGRSEFLLRYARVLEKEKGFLSESDLSESSNSHFEGTPMKLYSRYRFTYSNALSIGITGEKDPGENFFKGAQKNGFDFYSAHFFIRSNKKLKALAIGDYQLGFGQGLTLWTGLAFGKSADVINIKKNARGISPNTSVDENRFMRGVAETITLNNFELTTFFSYKKTDANLSETDTILNEPVNVSSLQETGYHRTQSEINDRHSLGTLIYGGNLSFKKNHFQAGITGVQTSLELPLITDKSLYNHFEFSGKILGNIGGDYNLVLRNMNFFGEVSISSNGGLAFLNGLIISLDPRVSLSILQRNYGVNYQNLYSNALAESSIPSNENGVYFGLSLKPLNTITFSGYYDQFKFPWLKYQVNQPSFGNDWIGQLNYTPSKKLDIYFRARKRIKLKNTGEDETIDFVVPVEQNNYRFNVAFSLPKGVKIKSRIENITYDDSDKKKEKGYLLSQDILYQPLGKPFSVSLRYALFQTDSYNSRIYSYESDIPGSYSIPAYYDKGSRFYLMLDYELTRSIEAWVRYSQTIYDQKKIISEGSLSEIRGNRKSEIQAQLRIRF